MTLLVLPGWWNFKLESANLKEYIQTSRIITLKNNDETMLPSRSSIVWDEVYIPNSIPNLVSSTFTGYLFCYIQFIRSSVY